MHTSHGAGVAAELAGPAAKPHTRLRDRAVIAHHYDLGNDFYEVVLDSNDVGCGWGSLVLLAAEHYGVHATGLTLSRAQAEFIRARVAERGLAERVDVRWGDYRELPRAAADYRPPARLGSPESR